MNQEAQRIAIAEACGWCFVPEHDRVSPEGHTLIAVPEGWINPEGEDALLPDYPNDLNAMHEAEGALTEDKADARGNDQCCRYITHLGEIVGCWKTSQLHNSLFQQAHATAAQRAEAFLRTIGKWTDS